MGDRRRPPPAVLFSTASPDEAVRHVQTIAHELIRICKDSTPPTQPLAIFDVDETLLLNHPTNDDKVAANPPIKRLHDWLKRQGVKIFVVTARRKGRWSRAFVDKQLKAIGYPAPQSVEMVNKEHDQQPSASRFKLNARERIAAKTGGRIILNAGDQASDMFLVEPAARAADAATAKRNTQFARRHLPADMYHGIENADGISALALKLPADYIVA